MRDKVILVVLDGLAYETARSCMGFMHALTEQGIARLYKLECELPSLSRPLYETILTGVTPALSGISHNNITRNSNQRSIFHRARDAGMVTAAAAYHWISELYNRTPYDAVRDRFTDDPELPIQHGCFYHLDHYPDDHLILDGEWLRRKHDPDFLLIHPMNIDDAGHKAGLDSSRYRNAARMADVALSHHLPEWIRAGYQILITADHGMNNDCSHGGTLAEEREVPLFTIGGRFSQVEHTALRQTELCPLALELLGIQRSENPEIRALLKETL
ncbi:alkaline phosphatase family protein [Marinobacterium mangrovicola]|uniref:Type I phosphodiesterase/nucleotide pyrophosphatase n=1 Tax=Marinobacterium mangrovicola TaxID=1476959 RepID=A0A4V2PED1_9GAMM|nr:alkaline phosphatase family protein [Marinobacterium mangrovicola]TCK08626.1 type I phosphodiesterase/nucleotide pyrophosphatase [Marinobacterium mangrovicola]